MNHFEWSQLVIKNGSKSLIAKGHFTDSMCNFLVSIVPADGLARLGARSSAGKNDDEVWVYS